MSKKESTEHELIKTRQRRISLPFVDAKPSEVTEVYWICAIRKKGDYPKPTTRSGKWLIFARLCMPVFECCTSVKRQKRGREGRVQSD